MGDPRTRPQSTGHLDAGNLRSQPTPTDPETLDGPDLGFSQAPQLCNLLRNRVNFPVQREQEPSTHCFRFVSLPVSWIRLKFLDLMFKATCQFANICFRLFVKTEYKCECQTSTLSKT
ncbi:hypothetical protein MG293_011269 [Ovis ammon polii]|uniref:Uncharacterized protein n=1 Tax=Ovis ammon polii TaxID=230172 RepID=A0AAD4U657_OVIAM|nr:hypothetical protein MG293_011269 [Ovis ammon polii]